MSPVTRIQFIDESNTLLLDVNLGAVPRVGDAVDLHTVHVSGTVERVTWRVGDINAQSVAIVRVAQ